MTTRLLSTLIVVTGLSGAPAAAQDSSATPPSRPAPGPSEQQAAVPVGPRDDKDKIERLLDFVEDNPALRLINARDGWAIRVGGIEDGSSLAAGPAWSRSSAMRGLLSVTVSAAAAVTGDRGIDAGVAFPELGSHRLALGLTVSADHLAQERFFGPGATSPADGYSAFALDRRETTLGATLAARRWLRVSTGATHALMETTDAIAPAVPAISTRWTVDHAPGLHKATRFMILSAHAIADRRDVPGNPRRGGRYGLRFERYLDRSLDRYSFSRVLIDAEQHLPWWRGQRLLTLRANAVLSDADHGSDVPFYLQPTLGGSRYLRGFVTDRFRDRNLFVAQAEYAWDIWPFLNAVLFYEAGHVAPHWQQLTVKTFKHDYGIGFRLGSARTVALRTDVAFGSGEGTRITMRFSHAF